MNKSADIKSALNSYAVALDHTAKQRDPLDPMTLQQRKVDHDMNDLLHEHATQPTLEAEPTRRKFGTAIRVGAGALIGALVTGGVFLASGNGGSPTGQVVTEAPAAPYLLKFSPPPSGLCLQFANTANDYPEEFNAYQNTVTILRRGEAEVVTVQAQFNTGTPESLVAKTVDINGHRATLRTQGSQRSLQWAQGRTQVQATADGVSENELVAIARSVVLTFDENGVRIGSIKAPGFTMEQADPRSGVGYGNLAYGECNQQDFNQPSKSLSINTTGTNIQSGPGFGFDPYAGAKRETIAIQRNGKKVKGSKIENTVSTTDGPFTNTFYVWTENKSTVMVNASKLSEEEVLQYIDSLVPATPDEYETFKSQAKPPIPVTTAPAPLLPGTPEFMQQTPQRKIGSMTVGKRELDVISYTQNDNVCVLLQSNFFGGGGGCLPASKKPIFTSSGGSPSVLIGTAIADSSIASAKASFPDGSSKDVPSFQDDRVPNARIFVLARAKDDPVASKIEFFDATGKVVFQQDESNDSLGPPTTMAVMAPPPPVTAAR